MGRVPRLNEDLLDVDRHYLLSGDMFWLAIDEDDRVIGCIGFNRYGPDSAKLHRLYVKYNRKRQGIGTRLLETAEQCMKGKGYRYAVAHLGRMEEYFESRQFYPRQGYTEYEPGYLRKAL